MNKEYKMPELENIKVASDKFVEETKEFLQKPRYEYYKGTTEVIDNELDTFVEDVVDRLNEQYFNKKELLKIKQNQDEQIADLQHRLKVAENALNKMAIDWCLIDNPNKPSDMVKKYKEQAEKETKGE